MSLEENKILIRPSQGAYLPVLDIVHKVTAGASGGSIKIEEWGLPPGEMMCYVGGEIGLAQEGSYVIKPRGVPTIRAQ